MPRLHPRPTKSSILGMKVRNYKCLKLHLWFPWDTQAETHCVRPAGIYVVCSRVSGGIWWCLLTVWASGPHAQNFRFSELKAGDFHTDGPGITSEKHCFRQRRIFGSLKSTEVTRSEERLGRFSLELVTKLKTRSEGLEAGSPGGRQRAGGVLGIDTYLSSGCLQRCWEKEAQHTLLMIKH